ncbi:MAG TPA: hypothetical protein VG756_09670 [Pseudonocardiaceae bacterium]|nr:hypothetical protein [Pseudonocardiaceae bacterium]
MYIDNGDAGDSGELKIDVDGHEYTEQENFSTNSDGVLDSYEVDTAGGDHLVYSDTDHDGSADEVTELDAQGDVTRQAHFDAASGHWVTDGGADSSPAPDTSSQAGHSGGSESISVDTATGEVSLGPATVDSNSDGTPDTVVVHDANGDTILYTDTNGDGQADQAVEISPDGHVVTAEHTGDHEWTETETGHLDAQGQYHEDSTASGSFTPEVGPAESGPDGSSPSGAVSDAAGDEHWGDLGGAAGHPGPGAAPSAAAAGSADGFWHGSPNSGSGVVRIDAGTGQWISPN